MPEGKVRFHAQHTPSWETFETVTLTASVSQVGGNGNATITADVPVDVARAFAAQILYSCDIVEGDQ